EYAYRRVVTSRASIHFANEEIPADSLNGAYLQVEEARFDQSGIRSLYESEAFPLERRPRPAATEDKADAARVFPNIGQQALGDHLRGLFLSKRFRAKRKPVR